MPQKRVPLFDTTEDQTLRIQKELAVKIGFNEAVVLMQLEYLISISNNHINDNWWTYQTLEELKENSFPWWSIATISRILRSLKDQDIIFIDSFNKRKGDKTQWFALDLEKINELGVKLNKAHPIFQFEKWSELEQAEPTRTPQIEPESPPEPQPILQNGDTIFQFEKPIFQPETTLPKTPINPTTTIPTYAQSPTHEEQPQDSIGILLRQFLISSQLSMPRKKEKLNQWRADLGDILKLAGNNLESAKKLIEDTIKALGNKYTIVAPQSIYDSCAAEWAKIQRQEPERRETNGHHSGPARASPPPAGNIDQERYRKLQAGEL